MPLLIEYLREFGRFQRNARLYLISNALSGVTVGIILVLYNLYLTALGYAPDFVGLVLFAGTLGAGAAIFPAGLCVDRFSGRWILIWASMEIGVAGAGQFLFHQPLPLLVSAFAAGVGGAFILVVNAPFLTANSQPAERPHLFSLNIVVTLAATVLGEVIGGALPIWLRGSAWLMGAAPSWLAWALVDQPQARSYQLALLLAGCIAAPSFVPLFMMSNERSTQSSVPRSTDEFKVSSISIVAGLCSAIARAMIRLRKTRWRAVVVSPLFVMVAVQALTGMGAGLFLPYFNIYFVKHLGASSALFGLIDGGANALNAVLTLAAPWLAARIGKVNSIVATRAASIPLLLTIGLTGLLPLAAALYPLRQGMADMEQGILQVFSMEVVPRQRRGLANSSYQASYQVAWALTTPLGGLIIAREGYALVFIVAAILYLLALATLWGRFGRGEGERVTAEINP